MPAKKINSTRPNIFTYHDHLSFLKDWFEFLKREGTGFSMRTLATKAKLAVGYMPMCLSGKRVLSTKALHKMMPYLKMNNQERRFFELLHLVGTSEEASVRLQAIHDMSRLQAFYQNNAQDVDVYQYLTKWYYVAIREMVSLTDFKADPYWIQGRIGGRLSLAECEQALAFLIEKGFILKDDAGNYRLPEKSLDCSEGIFKVSLSEFHRQMFHLAAQSIEKVPRSHRYIVGHTFSLLEADLEKVKTILDEARAKIRMLAHGGKDAAHVYHVELASFPLTRVKGSSLKEEL